MGTDIYMYAEIQRDGAWHLLGEIEENGEFCPEENPYATPDKPKELYQTRNYDLFAILADVRNPNGRTFDHQKFEVIAPLRGLPADMSAEIDVWAKDYNYAEHDEPGYMSSPGWLLLAEILDFDWYGKVMRYEAMVDARAAHLFDEKNPFPWRQWPAGVELGYAQYLRDGITVRWVEAYADAAGHEFLDLMNSLKEHANPALIRLVFWFGH